MNAFYARFDNHDFREETGKEVEKIMKGSGSHNEYVVSENDVACVFRSVNVRKCGGPDGLKVWIFKHCTLQLSSIYAFMFNWSTREHLVLPIWKTSELIPVPKKSAAKELNDLRPVALTSFATKCLEKLKSREIKKCFSVIQDLMQFAYRENRNVEDAILVFLQNVYKHLDTPKKYCRILFVDFSSAFKPSNHTF